MSKICFDETFINIIEKKKRPLHFGKAPFGNIVSV